VGNQSPTVSAGFERLQISGRLGGELLFNLRSPFFQQTEILAGQFTC